MKRYRQCCGRSEAGECLSAQAVQAAAGLSWRRANFDTDSSSGSKVTQVTVLGIVCAFQGKRRELQPCCVLLYIFEILLNADKPSQIRMIFKWGIVTELVLSVIFITCFYTYLHFNTYVSVKNEILMKGRFRYKILVLSGERYILE